MKKNLFFTLIILTLGLFAIISFSVVSSYSTIGVFSKKAYILEDNFYDVSKINIEQNSKYNEYRNGYVKLDAVEGTKTVSTNSFVHYVSDESVESFADGTLLDLNDLSNNFINYYYIPSGMVIYPSNNGTYTAYTEDGQTIFGENIWKLTDNNYLIQSSNITVYATNIGETVDNYLQVSVSDDGIVSMMSSDNVWRTFSDECYVETQKGIKIYPTQELVTDGNYKLSLAKINVDPDESIVLSEGETRRQIVPEINIEAIDGKDGTSSEDGEDGTSGENGGRGGDAIKGSDGKNVNDVSSVNSALPVISFIDWQVTTNSVRGVISITDESGFLDAIGTNDLIDTHPATVTITNNDSGETIDCYPVQFSRDQSTGKITYDLTSGISSSANFEDMYKSEEVGFTTIKDPLAPSTSYNISISAYYADVSSGTNETIYYREFISRNFYTDTAGVSLIKNYADTNIISVVVNTSTDKRENIRSARVFLLDGVQVETFNLATASSDAEALKGYMYVDMNYATGQVLLHRASGATEVLASSINNVQELVFPGLSNNKEYYGRVYITDTQGSASLNSQVLELKTLKELPTYDKNKKVVAYYNRVTGGFEVYRPSVSDQDAGIVKYVYSVIGDEDKLVQTREVFPSESEPVVFYLTSGTPYVFKCDVEFYDNDKTSYFSFVESDVVTSYGSTLPKLILTSNKLTSSTFDGTLQIKLDDKDTKLYISTQPNQYLQLDIYADGIYDETITLNTGGEVFASENGYCTATYLAEENSNYTNLALSFIKLCSNTNYTITVNACLDLNDGNGLSRRSLGSVSFMTRDMAELEVKMSVPDNVETEASIALNLKISPKKTAANYDFIKSELQNGEVSIGLYTGTNQNKNLIVSTTLDKDEINGISDDGILVTEDTFGSTSINPNSEYTVVVESVSDSTYDADLNYINYFEVAYPNYLTLNADSVLPDLLEDASKAMNATPIINRYADTYGGKYNENIPDDSIIGFKIQAKYDNSGRLAKYVNYYAYEWSTFVSSVMDGIDPIRDYDEESKPKTNRLYEVSVEATDSNSLPSIVLLFGDDPSTNTATTPLQSSARYVNNSYVFYAGKTNITDGELQSGMGRGFKYTFAYTVTYENKVSQQESIYPYSYSGGKKGTYESYREYGAGILNGVKIVNINNPIFVLNSGVLDAPSIAPTFNTYVYDTTIVSAGTNTNPTANGTVTIHYHYSDPDELIVETGNNATQIEYLEGSKKERVSLVSYDNDRVVSTEKGNEWYQITIPYSAEVPADLYSDTDYIELAVDITEYNGIKSEKYIDLLTKTFGYDEDSLKSENYLCVIPVDWSWQNYFNNNSEGLKFELDSTTLTSNYFTINIETTGTQYSELIKYAKNRGAMIEVTAQILKSDWTPDTTYDPDVFELPLQCDSFENESPIKAYLTTGQLGTKYIGKTFSVECGLKYEDGYIGTKYTEKSKDTTGEFLVRNFNYDTEDNEEEENKLQYSGYLRSKNTLDIQLPNANIMVDKSTSKNFSTLLRDVMKDKYKFRIPFEYIYTNSSTSYYAYPYNNGFMLSQGSALDSSVNDYSVIKSVSTLAINHAQDKNIAQLINITPTITDQEFVSTATTIKLNTLIVKGIDSIDGIGTDKRIGLALYTNSDSAKTLSTNDRIGEPQFINLSDETVEDECYSYKYSENEESGNVVIFNQGIEEGKTYYVAIFATMNSVDRLLLDAGTGVVAVYSKSTLARTSVTIKKAQYYNYGYFDKNLEVSYALGTYNGLSYRYDIYDSDRSANDDEITYTKTGDKLVAIHTEGCEPVITYEDLVDDERISEPYYYSVGSIRIDLTPGELRKKLGSGKTYYIKMTAYEENISSAIVLGNDVASFDLPSKQEVSTFISIEEATSSSVKFLVSISDPGYYIMGDKNYPNGEGDGLYTVRFTYDYTDPVTNNTIERLLVTDYDGLVFSTSSSEGLKKEFILDNTHLLHYNNGEPVYDGQEIVPSRNYSIHIFAVCDTDEDGYSELTNLNDSESKKTWDYFFKNTKSDKKNDIFNTFINSFWPINTNPSLSEDTTKSGIRDLYEIGNSHQRTLGVDEKYYVNTDYASFVRSGTSKLLLRLSESFGVAEENNTQQAFKKIVYSVTGTNEQNKPVSISGQSLASKNQLLFVKTESYGYAAYEYTLSSTIDKGRYTVTVQLYENETDTAPSVTVSKVFTD